MVDRLKLLVSVISVITLCDRGYICNVKFGLFKVCTFCWILNLSRFPLPVDAATRWASIYYQQAEY